VRKELDLLKGGRGGGLPLICKRKRNIQRKVFLVVEKNRTPLKQDSSRGGSRMGGGKVDLSDFGSIREAILATKTSRRRGQRVQTAVGSHEKV